MHAGAAIAVVVMIACGDDKGFESLDDFYAPSSGRESSSSGGSSSGGSGEGTGITCSISTNALLAYLPFDGDGRVRGSSTFETTNASSLSFVSGTDGSALRGSDQIFMKATKSVSMSSWTACAWVRVASSSNMGFLAVPGSPPLNSGFGVPGATADCGSGSLTPYLVSSTVGCVAPSSSSSSSLFPGTFAFVCMVSGGDSGRTQILVDGAVVATTSGTIPLSVTTGGAIAVGGGPDEASSGQPNALDDFSFWGRALSPAEMGTLSERPCRATAARGSSEDSP